MEPEIQEAFENCRPIKLTQPSVTLTSTNDSADFLEKSLEWLKQCLTDKVRLVRLNLTYTVFSKAAEQILYEIILARKGLKIVVGCDDYSIFSDITFSAKSRSKIRTELFIHQEDLFEHITPQLVLDALTAGGKVNLPPFPFKSVILDKESPKAPPEFIGLTWPQYNNDISDAYMEAVSKLPLKIFKLEITVARTNEALKLLQYLNANALGLQELEVTIYLSRPLITALNHLVANLKLKTLTILLHRPPNEAANDNTNDCFEIHSLAHNRSIEHLKINIDCDQIQHFIEPLRKNQSLRSITLRLTKFSSNKNIIDHVKRLTEVLGEKRCLRCLDLSIGYWEVDSSAPSLNLFLSAVQNKNITSLRLEGFEWYDDPQFEAVLLENPHLTSLDLMKDDELEHNGEKLDAHIQRNIRNRNEFQINFLVLTYNIARTDLDPAKPNFLPKDVWCNIMSHIDYPGINVPFGDVLRELMKNSAIRRVVAQ